MASKAGKSETEWGERTEETGNNEWDNQANWDGSNWWKKKEETTVTGKVMEMEKQMKRIKHQSFHQLH